MIIQNMTKITHVQITHYIDHTKNNANKCNNAAPSPTFHAFFN